MLTSKAPTTVEIEARGVWHRFQVGAGEVDICLSGFDLANVSMGDVWAGKQLSVEARQGFNALGDIFGTGGEETLATALPSFHLSGHADYVLLLDDGSRESGTVECPALGLSDDELSISSLWCDTLAFMNGDRTTSWQTVAERRWQTDRPVRLSNGQSYLGQVAANDNPIVVEWVHDKTWGDDATHRIAFSVPSEP